MLPPPPPPPPPVLVEPWCECEAVAPAAAPPLAALPALRAELGAAAASIDAEVTGLRAAAAAAAVVDDLAENLRRVKLNAAFAEQDLRETKWREEKTFRQSAARGQASSDHRAPSIAFCVLYLPRDDELVEHLRARWSERTKK